METIGTYINAARKLRLEILRDDNLDTEEKEITLDEIRAVFV